MKKNIPLALQLPLLLSFSMNGVSEVTNYHRVFIPCYDPEKNLQIAIRMYYRANIAYFLLVNPYTFATEVKPVAQMASRKKTKHAPGYFTMQELEDSPYIKALNRNTAPPYKLQNYGARSAEHRVNGMFLTVDMCPSSKKFEANFFKSLVTLSNKIQQPVSVALAVTGLWMIKHPDEMDWLIQQQTANKLNITWVNHSFSHIYYQDLPLKENFLLSSKSNISYEILETEKSLLQKNQLPSVFFRFPGLVSNKELVQELQGFGLIPLGSNAWLAHGEKPKAGSIILVHGNSNEPAGIKMVMPLLRQSDLKLLPVNQIFRS